jgi:eukaryotic-like serine/threonine-protein kinase
MDAIIYPGTQQPYHRVLVVDAEPQSFMASTPEMPKVFGRYLLLRPLSRGGMGEVFLATSGELSGFEKLCVIKKVLPHLAEDQEFIHRFIDEAQVAIKLAHANIASVFEVGMADGEYFLALEYVEGRDLRRMLARLYETGERLPIDLALFVVREVASGLAYAHRKTDPTGRPLNLVHCDISPPNVLVSYEGEVKIIDFGIAKSALRVAATNPKTGFGKLGYMAPEQLVRGGVVDKRTDVYAAGVLLYELLTGERLFALPDGFDYKEVARAVAQGKHSLPSHRDARLYDFDPIVVKALATDANKRYQSAEELRDDLAVALARINPTITGDRLGAWVRQLFADEMIEERSLIAQASAVDLSDWADELTDSRTHTVSFALAPTGLHDAAPASAPVRPRMPVDSNRTALVEKSALAPEPSRSRRGLYLGVAAAGLVLLGVAAALLNRPAPARPTAVAPARPQPPPVPPKNTEVIVQPLASEPLPDAAPVPQVRALEPPARAPAPPPHKAKARTKPAAPPPREKEKAQEHEPSPQDVESKFIAVKNEYGAFRKSYGGRLDEEWNDILDVATYGRGDERFRKLSSKLDRFRQRMGDIKNGK